MNYLWDVLGDGRYRLAAHSVLAIVAKDSDTVVYLQSATGGILIAADAATVNTSFDEYVSNSLEAEQHAHAEQIEFPDGWDDWSDDKQADYLNDLLGNNNTDEEN